MEVNKQNIKAIIFDFDETMYYSPTIKQYYIAYIKRTLKTHVKLKHWYYEKDCIDCIIISHGFGSCTIPFWI